MNQSQSMAGLASLVQSRGRNGDSMLVHMTPGEVKGLQALAFAHGGQLSINPDTGLYEANFLKKLLPTILGVGLNFLVPGLGALGSGLLVGGVEAARTGDIGKGLMAGLGAYGGAGLGSALSGAGSVAASAAGTPGIANMTPEAFKQALSKEAVAKAAEAGTTKAGLSAGMEALKAAPMTTLKAVGTQLGTPGVAGLGMTAANAMTPDFQMPTGGNMEIDQSYYEGGDYDPVTGTFRQGRWRKGYPGFPGGMAAGGVIPAPNGNYPLARPSESVGGYEMDIDPYTGEERFADGGSVGNQSLEQYYQSLLAPPTQQGGGNQAFSNYLQNLNQFVASPIAAPQQGGGGGQPGGGQPGGGQPGGQPGGGAGQPGGGRPGGPRGGKFGGGDFGDTEDLYNGSGGMKWDANQGRFVPTGPQNPFAGGMPTGNPFAGFGNIDFSAIQTYFKNAGTGGEAGAGADLGGMPGGQNQFGGDQFTGPIDDQFGGDMGGDGGMMYPGGSKDFDETAGAYRGDTGQAGAGTPDLSGMDFSNLNLSGLQNLNLSGMGGAGSYMPDMSALGGDQQVNPNPFADNYSPPADMGMGEVAYRGGLPSFDMTGGGREYTPPPEFSSGPISLMQPSMPQPEPAPQPPPQQPAFDMSGMDFSGLAGLGALSGMPPQMAQAPEIPQMPQQPAFDYGAMMAQQPAPSFDMGGFGGGMDFGAMQQPAQQPAPAFDMGNFGGAAGMDFGGMDFGGMGAFAGGGSVEYAAAGKLLRGPGDGMSDSIKANISGRQEARLADGEFVIPADVVSHLGNGSTEAGSRKLYKMMADVRRARTGKAKQAPAVKVDKYIPG